MAPECGKPEETVSTKPVESGDNKMASSSVTPSDRIKATDHELKIMEVEGAISNKDQAIDTIEVDDEDHEVDIDSAAIPAEGTNVDGDTGDQQQQHDPLQQGEGKSAVEGDKMSTKSEPSSGGESNASYNHDPMDLLERIETNQEFDDDEDELASGDEENGKRHSTTAERWQLWMKRWPWLLHEESDGDCAFCLYCNVVININKKVKFIQQHYLSLYHQEREINYMAFKNSVRQKVRK